MHDASHHSTVDGWQRARHVYSLSHSMHRPRLTARHRFAFFAILLAALSLTGGSGCATEEKKPLTVTEWMQQPRVGESLR